MQAHQAQVARGQHPMHSGSQGGLLSRVTAPNLDRADLGRCGSRNFSDKDLHELVYQKTSSHKREMFTRILDPSAFERALTLIISCARTDRSIRLSERGGCERAAHRMRQCASEPTQIGCRKSTPLIWRLTVEGLVISSLERPIVRSF